MFHNKLFVLFSLIELKTKLEVGIFAMERLKMVECLFQVTVSNYWEAIGVVAAHKAGVNPYSLRRNRIRNIQHK